METLCHYSIGSAKSSQEHQQQPQNRVFSCPLPHIRWSRFPTTTTRTRGRLATVFGLPYTAAPLARCCPRFRGSPRSRRVTSRLADRAGRVRRFAAGLVQVHGAHQFVRLPCGDARHAEANRGCRRRRGEPRRDGVPRDPENPEAPNSLPRIQTPWPESLAWLVPVAAPRAPRGPWRPKIGTPSTRWLGTGFGRILSAS